MLKYHSIDADEYDAAVATPIELHIHQTAQRLRLLDVPVLLRLREARLRERPRAWACHCCARGGLTVTTTLNPKVQRAADRGVHQYVHQHEPNHVASAEAVVAAWHRQGEGDRGQHASTATTRRLGQNSIDYAVDQEYGGSTYGFHAGSTFKLFVLAAALKEGIPLGTAIHAPSSISITGYKTCAGLDAGTYNLHNAGDSESGNVQPRVRHLVLGEHLLRPARAAHRTVHAGQARRVDGDAAVERRSHPAGAIVRARVGRRFHAARPRRTPTRRWLPTASTAARSRSPRSSTAKGASTRCRSPTAARSSPPVSPTR